MIEFELDDDQKMLVEAVGRFAEEQIRKVFRDADEEGNIPKSVIDAGRDFGLVAMAIPEEYGGYGGYSSLTGALAMETMAYGDLATALLIGSPALVALPVAHYGTEEQKRELLPGLADGPGIEVSAALLEPAISFDPRSLKTTATRNGKHYVLDGSKSAVPLADKADRFLIYASESGVTQAFLVPSGSSGLLIGEREKLMGIKGLPTFRLTLQECRVPVENKLGGSEGIEFEFILSRSRVALGAAAVGVAKASYEYAREYASRRVQFGEPIAYRQSIAFMLAEMAIDVDAARLLVWEAAWRLDRGQAASREAAVMKRHVDQMVLEVADKAVQVLGGYGYIREFPVEMWLRNARGFASFEGLAII